MINEQLSLLIINVGFFCLFYLIYTLIKLNKLLTFDKYKLKLRIKC